MRRSLGVVVGVVALAAIGFVCLRVAYFERRMAIAQEDMLVLDFADPQADYTALGQELEKWPWAPASSFREIRRRLAQLQYWRGDYSGLVDVVGRSSSEDETPDPELQHLAANAAYRLAQRGPQDKTTVLRNLDAAIRAYSEALRAGRDGSDTAFNYELAIRIREEINGGVRKEGMPKAPPGGSQGMHGESGQPPKEKEQQFKVRVPGGNREGTDETAGPGIQRRRRG